MRRGIVRGTITITPCCRSVVLAPSEVFAASLGFAAGRMLVLAGSLLLLSTPALSGRVLGQEPIPTPDELAATFEVADGYAVNLFASEVRFPIHNPLAMAFDPEGRLWIAVAPTYPQYQPGVPPRDKILVLEDTDRDGVADRCTTFADGLLVPTGFAIDTDGVWVAQQPNLWFLQDTDGDRVADSRRVVLHGFGTEDSHHSLSAFTWAPDGSFTFNEGVFHHTQVETPYGPIRARDAAVFRFKPSRHRLTVLSHRYYNNPWGHTYDPWGQSILSDASDGEHYNLASVIAAFDYPEKTLSAPSFLRRGRPMSGNTLLYSRHFPEEVQGTHLNNQCIGFHGVRWDRLIPHGSSWRTEPLPDLLQSSSFHFRPVGAQIGGDGALYVLDFCNPLIGHMQYSHRDPGRDHSHGRVWRITAKERPLLTPRPVRGASFEELIALLREPESHTRHFARRELQTRPDLSAEQLQWWTRLAASDPDRERLRLEALWICVGRDQLPLALLEAVLGSEDSRARAAGLRVLRHAVEDGQLSPAEALSHVRRAVDDLDQRVRLEAVVACGFLRSAEAAGVALLATQQPMDRALEIALQQTIKVLAKYGEPVSQVGRHFRLMSLSPADLARENLDERVALVQCLRADTDAAVRQAARNHLVKTWQRSRSGVFAELLSRADPLDLDVSALEQELSDLPREELTPELAILTRLVGDGERADVRQLAGAATIRATGDLDLALTHAGDPADVYRSVTLLSDASLLAALQPQVVAALASAADPDPSPRARYVRVSLPRPGTLTLAEVQVFREDNNLAPAGRATHRKTAHGAGPELAIDGNTNGAWSAGTSTHTPEGGPDPWWELDLGESSAIDQIVIWNRTDANLGQRLDGFDLELLDEERQVRWARRGVEAPARSKRFTLRPSLASRRAMIEAAAHLPEARAEVFPEFARLRRDGDKELARAARQAMNQIPFRDWPPGFEDFRGSSIDPAQFALGKAVYERDGVCQTCHQSHGNGVPQSFPPLRGSPWVVGDDEALIRIVLHGLRGPIEVAGKTYSSSMEPLGGALTDAEIAAVLTFVRNYWGNEAPSISESRVAEVRERDRSRSSPWTVAELRGQPAPSITPRSQVVLWWALLLGIGSVGVVGSVILLNLRSRDPKESA